MSDRVVEVWSFELHCNERGETYVRSLLHTQMRLLELCGNNVNNVTKMSPKEFYFSIYFNPLLI